MSKKLTIVMRVVTVHVAPYGYNLPMSVMLVRLLMFRLHRRFRWCVYVVGYCCCCTCCWKWGLHGGTTKQKKKTDMKHDKFRRHKPQWQWEYGKLQDKVGCSGGEVPFFFNRNNSRLGIKPRLYTIHKGIENSSFHWAHSLRKAVRDTPQQNSKGLVGRG